MAFSVVKDPLQREQDAFDAELPRLLPEHPGEFVIFKDKHPVAFFRSFDEAYGEALKRFGLDEIFLITQVAEPSPTSLSLTWDLAVL
jgi:hypothetical protein